MEVGTNFAEGNKKWIEDGLRYEHDRKHGLAGSRGESLRLKRPVQLHLHTMASPRKYLEKQGEGKLTMEDYVRFKVTRLLRVQDQQEPLDDSQKQFSFTPREEILSPRRLAAQPNNYQSAVSPRPSRLTYGDAMRYIEKIQKPQREIKSRPITNMLIPRLHGFSPRLSSFAKPNESKFSSSERTSAKGIL